jgi:hypothetical protein
MRTSISDIYYYKDGAYYQGKFDENNKRDGNAKFNKMDYFFEGKYAKGE